jgi:hypothetical protein
MPRLAKATSVTAPKAPPSHDTRTLPSVTTLAASYRLTPRPPTGWCPPVVLEAGAAARQLASYARRVATVSPTAARLRGRWRGCRWAGVVGSAGARANGPLAVAEHLLQSGAYGGSRQQPWK